MDIGIDLSTAALAVLPFLDMIKDKVRARLEKNKHKDPSWEKILFPELGYKARKNMDSATNFWLEGDLENAERQALDALNFTTMFLIKLKEEKENEHGKD